MTADDIVAFVRDEPPESDVLEFKETLPEKKGGDDRWITHGDRLGDHARDVVLAEAIGFANTHGGVILLGVEESDSHPKRAKSLKPVPRVHDLADRLRLMARDLIEPQLPMIEAVGVETSGNAAGVVVLRVGESRLAPHRLTSTKECYVRRADRTERMTMREIQDLVLMRSASATRLDDEFRRRRQLFREWQTDESKATLRITGIPTAPQQIADVYSNEALRPTFGSFVASPTRASGESRYSLPISGWGTRPILAGARTSTQGELQLVVDVLRSGLVEYAFLVPGEKPGSPKPTIVYGEWLACVIWYALLHIDRVRSVAGVPGQEYAIEVELWRASGPFSLTFAGQSKFLYQGPQPLPSSDVILPRLSIGERSTLPASAGLIYTDILNSVGYDVAAIPFVPEFPGGS